MRGLGKSPSSTASLPTMERGVAHEGGQRVAVRTVGNIAGLQVFFEQQVTYRIDGVLAAQGCNSLYGQALVHIGSAVS